MFNDMLKLSKHSRNLVLLLAVPFVLILLASTVCAFTDYDIMDRWFGVRPGDFDWTVLSLLVGWMIWYIPFVVLSIKEQSFNKVSFIMIMLMLTLIVYFTYFAI